MLFGLQERGSGPVKSASMCGPHRRPLSTAVGHIVFRWTQVDGKEFEQFFFLYELGGGEVGGGAQKAVACWRMWQFG